MDMERTQIYLTPALKKQLHTIADEDNETVSAVLRYASEEYIKKRKEDRRRRKANFLKALDDIAGIWADRNFEGFMESKRGLDKSGLDKKLAK